MSSIPIYTPIHFIHISLTECLHQNRYFSQCILLLLYFISHIWFPFFLNYVLHYIIFSLFESRELVSGAYFCLVESFQSTYNCILPDIIDYTAALRVNNYTFGCNFFDGINTRNSSTCKFMVYWRFIKSTRFWWVGGNWSWLIGLAG